MNPSDPSLYTICPDARLTPVHLGHEAEPVLLIDNFITGAQQLKDYAIAEHDFAIKENFYPGVRMAVPLLYTVALAKNLEPIIRQFFGADVSQIKTAASRFSIVTTPPEQLTLLQKIPHIDAPSRDSLAVVHYLADRPTMGTALYRHRATGYEFVDEHRYVGYQEVIRKQFPHPEAYPLGYIHGDTPEFEVIGAFEAVFNRMVMYRGSSLHSGLITPEYDFDASPSTGRLTITTFIEFNA